MKKSRKKKKKKEGENKSKKYVREKEEILKSVPKFL